MIQSIKDNGGQWESLEALMEERADILVRHAFEGYGIGYDEALDLIKKQEDLSNEERIDRDILVAAVDNLSDFAVVEEYQMALQIPDFEEFDPDDYPDLDDPEELEDYIEGLCEKYNNKYAWTEDMDVEYAMIVAAFLSKINSETMLTYMTQGDERVRPWHAQYEGFTAPRSAFPQWLIPPIEHQCRCFLVEDEVGSVMGDIQAAWEGGFPEMPEWFNRTFKESVANGGRIFSDEHPYFQVQEEHVNQLREISNRIKAKYLSND